MNKIVIYPFLVKPLLGKFTHLRSDHFWVNSLVLADKFIAQFEGEMGGY